MKLAIEILFVTVVCVLTLAAMILIDALIICPPPQ